MASKEDSYWPGLVDALTNVVFALILFVMILALIFMTLAVKIARMERERANVQIAEVEARVAQPPETGAGQATPPGTPAPPVPKLFLSNPKNPKVEKAKVTTDPDDKPKSTRTRPLGGGIFVSFPPELVGLDDAAKSELERILQTKLEELKQKGVTLRAEARPAFVTEGRRKAFYRAVAIRNWLVERGFKGEQIDMRITDEPIVEGDEGVEIAVGGKRPQDAAKPEPTP